VLVELLEILNNCPVGMLQTQPRHAFSAIKEMFSTYQLYAEDKVILILVILDEDIIFSRCL